MNIQAKLVFKKLKSNTFNIYDFFVNKFEIKLNGDFSIKNIKLIFEQMCSIKPDYIIQSINNLTKSLSLEDVLIDDDNKYRNFSKSIHKSKSFCDIKYQRCILDNNYFGFKIYSKIKSIILNSTIDELLDSIINIGHCNICVTQKKCKEKELCSNIYNILKTIKNKYEYLNTFYRKLYLIKSLVVWFKMYMQLKNQINLNLINKLLENIPGKVNNIF